MEQSVSVVASEKTTEGGLDTHGYDYTLSDKHRFRSLLLRESNKRAHFWSHVINNPDFPLMCCDYQDIRVHIMICHENPWDVRAKTVTHDGDLDHILSGEYRASPALFVFIDSQDQASRKLSLSWPMLRELVASLDVMPQFSDFLPWERSFQKSRDSMTGGFASSTKNGVEEICLSLYHCCIQRSEPGEKHSASIARALIYIQAQHERLRWIVIGRPGLWDLQTVYLDAARQELLNLSPTFIVFVAMSGWQIMLSLIEDDLTKELDTPRDPTNDSHHTTLIDALFRLQSQIFNATWQIEANISVLRSLAKLRYGHHTELHASSRLGFKLVLDNVDLISTALEELERRAARAKFLTRQVHSAIKQATQKTAHVHASTLEAFSWHNLKLNYAVESGTRQTTVIFALLAPAIFTSTLFSTNFFSLSADGSTLLSQGTWIWFATTLPLTSLFLGLVYAWNRWRTVSLIRVSRARNVNAA